MFSGVQLELEIWRATGRFPELGEAFEHWVPHLEEALGSKALIIYRFDPERLRAERVAQVGADDRSTHEELKPEVFAKLATWCHEGRTLRADSRSAHPMLERLIPPGLKGPILAGPLVSGPHGVGEPI